MGALPRVISPLLRGGLCITILPLGIFPERRGLFRTIPFAIFAPACIGGLFSTFPLGILTVLEGGLFRTIPFTLACTGEDFKSIPLGNFPVGFVSKTAFFTPDCGNPFRATFLKVFRKGGCFECFGTVGLRTRKLCRLRLRRSDPTLFWNDG